MDRLLFRPARRLPGIRSVILQRAAWVCPSCRPNGQSIRAPRSYSTGTAGSKLKAKPFYVTTPIFYVNASPHIGHMFSMLLADVLKRWEGLKGKPALLLTGTDEHGLKVQQAAAANETAPKLWCDAGAAKFKDLAEKSNIANDFFIRTTDKDHRNAVRHFWFILKEQGYIYEKKHEGWYCISDETFYPESMLEKRIDPLTGKVTLTSKETGNAVEWTQEKNYHFRMTALKDKLLQFYESSPEWIVPQARMQEVVRWVQDNLEDLSISRPSSRLEWGIRVPEDNSQTIYVWVDALVNYLTKAGFPGWTPGKEEEGGWPADVQVIGKDILRFHGVYWPALLLAVGISPPKKLLSHAHWTLGGRKMSKSVGNVVNPFYAINRWGVDTIRFFMIHDAADFDDSDYDNSIVVERYKTLLQNALGNLLSRVTRPKLWSVREAVEMARPNTKVPEHELQPERDMTMRNQQAVFKDLHLIVDKQMAACNPRSALLTIFDAISKTNKFLAAVEPWNLAKVKSDDPAWNESRVALDRSVYLAADSLRNIGICLQPFMPGKAEEMLDILGVRKDRRTLEYAGIGKDYNYGTPMQDPGQGSHQGLFPPLGVET